jgi:hypothetical protein
MGEIPESEYSNLFVLVGGPKIRVVRSHYGAPDHNSQPDCNEHSFVYIPQPLASELGLR